MVNQGEALYRLQQIELGLQERIKRLNAISQQLNNNQAVQAAQQAVDAVQAQLKPLQTRQRDIELQIQSTRSKRAATEQRLYSGTVKNPKELQEMQQEIAALQRRDAELEDNSLEVLLEVEAAQAELQTTEAELAKVKAAFESQNQDLIAERTQLRTEAKKFEADKAPASALLTPENLTLYQTMKPQKANRPISRLDGVSCSVCGIEQTSLIAAEVRKQQGLVKCKSCGRILVYVP